MNENEIFMMPYAEIAKLRRPTANGTAKGTLVQCMIKYESLQIHPFSDLKKSLKEMWFTETTTCMYQKLHSHKRAHCCYCCRPFLHILGFDSDPWLEFGCCFCCCFLFVTEHICLDGFPWGKKNFHSNNL